MDKTIKQIIAFAYKLFGRTIENANLDKSEIFSNLKEDLKFSNLEMSLTEYLCVAMFCSILSFVVATPIISIFILLITGEVFFGLFLAVFGSFFLSIFVFVGFYFVPSMLKGEQNKKIDDILPFALSYLTIMAGSQNPSVSMFKTISRFDEYGEVSKESKKIVDEVELMGINFKDALANAADRTPSKNFKNILWGIRSTMEAGGNLKGYLKDTTKESMAFYKIRLSKYESQVMLLIEMYLTAVVVGSIFLLIISVIFSVIGSGSNDLIVTMQLAIVVLLLPVSSAGFILIERGMAPAQA